MTLLEQINTLTWFNLVDKLKSILNGAIITELAQLNDDSTHRVVTDTQITAWDGFASSSVTSVNGLNGVVVVGGNNINVTDPTTTFSGTLNSALQNVFSSGGGATPTLQQVLDNNHDLVNGIFKAGTLAGVSDGLFTDFNGLGDSAGTGNTGNNFNGLGLQAGLNNIGSNFNGLGVSAGVNNTGINFNGLGDSAGTGNTGRNFNGLGLQAGLNNIGSNFNGLGNQAGTGNTGADFNGFGNSAGINNTSNNVNLFGNNAQADGDYQTVFSKDALIQCRFDFNALTDIRKITWRDLAGTVALTSDIVTPTLQQVLDNNHDLVNGIFKAGTNAGQGNTGSYFNGLGQNAGQGNTGNYFNGLGQNAGLGNIAGHFNGFGALAGQINTGVNFNGLGLRAGFNNTGSDFNGFGALAGQDNIFNQVNLFGNNAQADGNYQTVFSKSATIQARFDFNALSAIRKITWQNKNGTVAYKGEISYNHTIFTPTTGQTVNIVNEQYNIVNPSGALLALTINLPPTPSDSDTVYIKYTQSVSTVNYTGGTVVGGLTSATGGTAPTILVYDGGTNKWY